MTINTTDLLTRIDKLLADFGYTKEKDISIPDVIYISYIKKPSPMKVRNLCAVIEVPDKIKDGMTAKMFFGFIRNSLLEKYGDAFLWKELEICFVILCQNNFFELIKKDEGKVVDQAAFSLNAMMGTCFINTDNKEHFPKSTWGIYFSGDHYKALHDTVSQWCKSDSSQ
jgi:hypothetical protein